MDAWVAVILKVMAELGNTVVNKIYEAQVYEIIARRAKPDSDAETRENWIKAKYVTKAFIRGDLLTSPRTSTTGKWTVRRLRRRTRTTERKKEPSATTTAKEAASVDDKDEDTTKEIRINAEQILFGGSLGKHHVANIELDSDQESTDGEEDASSTPSSSSSSVQTLSKLTPNHLLFRAARVHNLPVMSQALALGADRDFEDVSSRVIHQSILSGSVMACELLLLNGAKIDALDSNGDTPLHLAASAGNTSQVCLLLKHRANHHMKNKQGQQALDIAVANSDADIVTLLRLAALNEEIRDTEEIGTGDDDTFNDVVQEFSQMVYTHPERLHKKQQK